MFGATKNHKKPLKDANFLSVFVYELYKYVCMWSICLHAGERHMFSALSSYGSCETRNKRCSSCILTTKLVTQTNYYDRLTNTAVSNRLAKSDMWLADIYFVAIQSFF